MHGVELSMENISVAYNGDITVLKEVALRAKPGEVTGIIGPNGAGKSTVLKTIFGLLSTKTGTITMGGRDITNLKAFQRALEGVSFVPQNRSAFAGLSVYDNLLLGCWPFRKDKARIERAIDGIFERFPILKEKRSTLAGSMSGGQQRFLEIARALVTEPKVILLDEPTAMIAPKISKDIYALTRDLADQGATIILVDQNVRQCATISDRLYILELGRNKAEGTKEDFATDGQLKEMVAEWMNYKIDV
ncbi:ABC transporter ATP-binding protein [Nitratireductor sp. L1-7-SE]|uniref:ABC transporter ATP-binding protein n=1 Tax=Nitratireductor rhodophyticola TaxID=2854036 RepID=A0ABS7RB59_9HYPH|nr:ABC transporter ATP-binding protein [Nitratireductor rhodophyticola]MBY8917844.1 ABC transporter ATP-binding protein [Nitratireductor rhodophyticola]MBY8922555.1 ABC transporter ATP-binding protein [Nitratireductor rhodophyticola]